MRPLNIPIGIQMIVRQGGFIVGDVLARFLIQGIQFMFHIDATPDLCFTKAQEDMIQSISRSPKEAYRIRISTKAAYKRNRLRLQGNSPYVYLADPDVLLPDTPVFESMVNALERHPKLGAVGLCYQSNNHVAAGSMMLRRRDFERVGELKGGRCICNFISSRLREFGLHTVGFRTIRATHLKPEYRNGFPEYPSIRHKSVDGVLKPDFLEALIQQHGTRFKLFVEMGNEPAAF